MDPEKRFVAGWWFWILLLVLAAGIALVALNSAGVFTRTVIERKVFENSYQYNEARKTEIATYEAQLAEINTKLADPNLDQQTRRNLEAQKSAIKIQLNIAKERQK